MEERRGRRLVLIPLPLQGHINPMLELAHILHLKGFSISIIHIKYSISTNSDLNPHFTFSISSFPDGPTPQPLSATSDLANFLTLLNTLGATPFRHLLANLQLSHQQAERICCLISDAMCFFTQAVATTLCLPRIVFRTASISSFLAFSAFPSLIQKRYLPIQECELEEEVEEVAPLRVKDLPVVNTKDPHKFYELVRNFVNETMSSLGVIWNSFEALESSSLQKLAHQFPIPMYPIGPLHKYLQPSQIPDCQHHSCISWLHQHPPNSVVYASFGSIASISEAEFLEIAWGLANCLHPFLWVVRPGMIRGSEWLDPLPSGFLENLGGRGHIVKWAPQKQVLAHQCVGAFLSHNGWNSTMESICEGVPMICMPCFTDQNVNARYVSHVWKVGLQLEKGIERGEIERSIRMVMQGKEIRDRASILKEQARLCLKQGGSSYLSLQRLVTHIMSLNYTPSH